MARYATHKRTSQGRATTIQRRQARAAKQGRTLKGRRNK